MIDNFLTQTTSKGIVEMKGTSGLGKSLGVHIALHQFQTSLMGGDKFRKWKHGEYSKIIASNNSPIYKDKIFNGVRILLQQVYLQYCKRVSQEPEAEYISDLIRPVGDKADWELFLEMLDLKNYSWIKNFPPKKVDEEVQ